MHLVLSFALIAGAGALFAAIADELGAEEELGAIDQAFSDALARSVPPGVIRAFAWLTHLGDPWLLAVWCVGGALVLWGRGRRLLAFGLVLAIAGNGILNTTLKAIFERVRPVHDQAIATAAGWSFPSGHTSGSLVTYGMIAYVLNAHASRALASAGRARGDGRRVHDRMQPRVPARAFRERRAGRVRIGNRVAGRVHPEH